MGFWQSIKDIAVSSVQLPLNFLKYGVQSLVSAPKLVHHLTTHLPSRALFSDAAYIAAYDILPIYLLSTAQSYLEDSEEGVYWSLLLMETAYLARIAYQGGNSILQHLRAVQSESPSAPIRKLPQLTFEHIRNHTTSQQLLQNTAYFARHDALPVTWLHLARNGLLSETIYWSSLLVEMGFIARLTHDTYQRANKGIQYILEITRKIKEEHPSLEKVELTELIAEKPGVSASRLRKLIKEKILEDLFPERSDPEKISRKEIIKKITPSVVDFLTQDAASIALLHFSRPYLTDINVHNILSLYIFRRDTRRIARQGALMLKFASSLNEGTENTRDIACVQTPCSTKRFAQGEIRRTGNFFASKGLIYLTSFMPGIGNHLSTVFTASLMGEYFIVSSLHNVCERHTSVYTQQNPELVMYFGLLYMGAMWLITTSQNSLFGEVPELTAVLEQFLIYTLTALAIQMPLPDSTQTTNRWLLNPLSLYQRLVGGAIDKVLLQSKEYIRQMLKRPGSIIDWDLMRELGDIVVYNAISNPVTEAVRFTLTDNMLHDLEKFRHDPLIERHWKGLRGTGRDALSPVETYAGGLLVRGAAYAPWLVAKLGSPWVPKTVTKIAIKFLNDPWILEKVKRANDALRDAWDFPEAEQVDPSMTLGRPKAPSEKTPTLSSISEDVCESLKSAKTTTPAANDTTTNALVIRRKLKETHGLPTSTDSKPVHRPLSHTPSNINPNLLARLKSAKSTPSQEGIFSCKKIPSTASSHETHPKEDDGKKVNGTKLL